MTTCAKTISRLLVTGIIAVTVQAHVGSPDIYLDGKAGPYQLFVTVRPPQVIPGVAALEIRSESPGLEQIRTVPVPIAGPGAKLPPVPDSLRRSKEDAQFFTGSLWIMAPGSWQVRITATGDKGVGSISIPVPAAALRTRRMQAGIGSLLAMLGLFLVGGMVAIVGASVREARLAPGLRRLKPRTRKGGSRCAPWALLSWVCFGPAMRGGMAKRATMARQCIGRLK